MLERRKHDHRLSSHPAEFFSEVLERALQTTPCVTEIGDGVANRKAIKRSVDYSLFDEESGPFYFDLVIIKEQGEPNEQDLAIVRSAFAGLVVMDDAARDIPCPYDENEELLRVAITPAERRVAFDYCSTLWNSEWEVHFKMDARDNWECLGIPDWRSPGKSPL